MDRKRSTSDSGNDPANSVIQDETSRVELQSDKSSRNGPVRIYERPERNALARPYLWLMVALIVLALLAFLAIQYLK